MPQDYTEILDYSRTPVDFLVPSGEKEAVTRARSCLGSLRFKPEEMEQEIGELSGGQKAKLLLLRLMLDGSQVLVLDPKPESPIQSGDTPVSGGVSRYHPVRQPRPEIFKRGLYGGVSIDGGRAVSLYLAEWLLNRAGAPDTESNH